MNKIDPEYYRKGGIETFDFITAKGLSYAEGNIIKYVVRYKDKNGLEDLKKARWNLDELIKITEADNGG